MVLLANHALPSDIHKLLGLEDKKSKQGVQAKSPDSPTEAKSILASSDQGHSQLDKAIALATACGLSEQQTAEFLGVGQQLVADYKATQKVSDLINQASASAGLSPEQRIARVIPSVVDLKIKGLLTSKDEKLRSAIGTELLDRHFGKPVQTTQSFGVNVTASTTLEELDNKIEASKQRIKQIEDSRNKLKQSTASGPGAAVVDI